MKGKIKYVPKSSKPKNVSRTKRTRKGTRHEKAGRRDNENRPPKTSHVLDESLSSQTKPQFKKFKKKSKMKRKNKDLSVPVVGGKVKDLTLIEDRGSSSNWEAFLKVRSISCCTRVNLCAALHQISWSTTVLYASMHQRIIDVYCLIQ